MTRIERGATGFWNHGDEPAPETDPALLRTICWEAARRVGGRVGELAWAAASSFYSVAITRRAETHVVLCHAHLPVIAFADAAPVPGRPLTGFVDPPGWADGFSTVGFRCLSVEELRTPMSDVDATGLTEAELTQIRYWRPEALSDLLFNWWD
ncbi:hypothetical protein [Streptomyces sp. NPDC018693]|uniref:hypothetical protein n=1 Tax=unclassified Streptomyces TaxID=2593676 RepID=UPI0037A236E7